MLSHDKVVPSKEKDCHTGGQDEQREPISRYCEQGKKRNRTKINISSVKNIFETGAAFQETA